MGEPDSWEDMDEGHQQPASVAHTATRSALKLNANAPAFTFNPSAPSFKPHFSTGLSPTTPGFGQPLPLISTVGAAPLPVVKDAPAAVSAAESCVDAGSVLDLAEPASVRPITSSAAEPGAILGSDALVALSDSTTFVGESASVSASGAASMDDRAHLGSISEVNGDFKKEEEASVDESSLQQRINGGKDHVVESELVSSLAALDVKDVDFKEEETHDLRSKPVDILEVDSDKRQHLNVVFIGHVDAGKSTIGGQILYLSDMVDERTIQKYEREAKEKNRESWYMAYIMDTNEEERAKGKTVEVGRAHFETIKSRFTILDAPGHKNYVPNMISGASQADVGVLVIAARKGEFETGFERGGQTREHAQLAKTLGVSRLLVVVNKMDDPSVLWSKERFDEIEKKMIPFLRTCGYNVKKDVQFLPISGLFGHNMKNKVSRELCPWWEGPCLFDALDAVELPERDPNGPFRMPLIDKFKDMGIVVMGKIESGSVRRGDNLVVMPNKAQVKVVTVYRDNDEVNYARPGENLRIRISGVEEEDISSGFVLSSVSRPIPAVLEFDAQLQILELLDHKAIFTAGYKAVLHIHSVVEECEIIELLQQIDRKTKKPMKKKVLFVKNEAVVVAKIQVNELICLEKFEDFPQLGRFTLRDEGKTVAIGKVVRLFTASAQE